MSNQEELPDVIRSEVVPTEYDVWRDGKLVILSDDRSRNFSGRTLAIAFRNAESAQDPIDLIHHEPFPDPFTTPIPDHQRKIRPLARIFGRRG